MRRGNKDGMNSCLYLTANVLADCKELQYKTHILSPLDILGLDIGYSLALDLRNRHGLMVRESRKDR